MFRQQVGSVHPIALGLLFRSRTHTHTPQKRCTLGCAGVHRTAMDITPAGCLFAVQRRYQWTVHPPMSERYHACGTNDTSRWPMEKQVQRIRFLGAGRCIARSAFGYEDSIEALTSTTVTAASFPQVYGDSSRIICGNGTPPKLLAPWKAPMPSSESDTFTVRAGQATGCCSVLNARESVSQNDATWKPAPD